MQHSVQKKLINKALIVAIFAAFLFPSSKLHAQTACDSLTAYFTVNQSGNTVTVTSATEPKNSYMYWTMGDGQSRTGNPVTYTYATSSVTKVYTLCHIAYLNGNTSCKRDTICQQITVPGTGKCNSSFTFTTGPNIGQVNFTNTSTPADSITSYSWVFGPNYPISTAKSPTNVYTAAGTYGVCLGITTKSGCTSEWCDTIVVTFPKSSCDSLNAYNTYTNTGNTYTFTDPYGTNPKGFHAIWKFGDGSSAGSGLPITHTFPTNSATVTYTVCMYVYLPNSSCPTDSSCRQITVAGTGTSSCDSLNAKFTYSISGNSVTVTSAPEPKNSYMYWTMGDGQSRTGNPVTYTYATSSATQVYTLCHIVYLNNNTGCKRDTSCVQITIPGTTKSPCDSLTAYYDYTNTGNTYTFTNPYQVNPKGYHGYWKFGDGSTIASGTPVTHTFPTSSSSETYDVCFFVYLPNTTCPTDSFCRLITIPGTTPVPCDSLNAYFLPPTSSGNAYTFTSSKNPVGYHQYWTFGDGTDGSGSPVTHTYPSSSASLTYNVCHIVYYPNATCKADTFCRTITVPGINTGTCHANFTWSYGSGIRQINFNNTSTSSDSITKYSWYFGDNTTSDTKNPSHYYTYNTNSSYVVCMYITTISGCRSEKCDTITFPKSACDSLSAYFNSTNTGNTYIFSDPYATNPKGFHSFWNFGDGSPTASGIPVTHTFPTNTAAVTYNVCLHVYLPNSSCPVDSFCRSVTVAGTSNIPPCDSLTSHFDFSNKGNTFTFTSAHNPSGYHQYWTFGDGGTGSGSPVSHTYASSNATVTYTVCHYVYYPGATCKTDTTCQQVIVPGITNTTCKANFTYTIGSNGLVTFTDASTGGPVTWGWSFGDNTAGSPQQSPTHTYTASGTYRVCMYIVTTSGCTSDHCDTITVNLTHPCNANAEFQYAIHTTWVSFYPSQTTGVIHAEWNFGDGTTSTDSAAWITHTFPVSSIAVTYHVCHYVYLSTSPLCADTSCQDITVPGTPTNNCKAYFAWTVGTNGTISFTDLSTSADVITGWTWNFGDGNSSSTQSPSHAYNNLGKFRVCLNITTASGCTSEFCDTVTVSQTTPCTISSNFSYTNTANTFTFTSAQNSTAVHQYWTFGDGTDGSGSPASHTYAKSSAAKTYTVCHIVYLPGTSCIDTTCKDITVVASNTGTCNANYTWTLSTAASGLVTFTNTSTASDSVVSWSWYFGDNTSSSSFSPSHTYAPGVYYACLRLETVSGCVSYHCDSIHIGQAANNCHAEFKYQIVGCDSVQFTNQSTGGYTHTAWNFGDGNSSSDPNPLHVFAAGTWTVTLYAYNPNSNCTSSTTETITIQPCNTLNDTICGVVFSDNNSNGVMDSSEAPYANIEIHIGSNVIHADSFGRYQLIVPAGTYTVYVVIPAGCVATLPLTYNGSNATYSYYKINGSAGGTFCGYNFGINCNVDHICGKVFYDANNNGVQDSSEAGLGGVTILIKGTNGSIHHAYTNSAGEYCETVPSGTYTITIDSSSYSTCITTPLSINVNATGNGQSYIGNDFAVYCLPGDGDLSIKVTPNSTVTPGFPAWYSVQVCNLGASPMSGTATFIFDPSILTYNYSLPPQDAVTANTVSWNITNLAPGQCLYYWVAFNATAPLNPGQPVYTVAIVTPASGYNDANPNNNIDTLHQEVKASWDPNSKQAFQTNYSDPTYQVVSSVNANQKIEYTINFQNDGNANAINIVVDDNLSPDLDANSFALLSSSHPCTVNRNGSSLNVKFSNINLPPSSVDEPGSHGYVKYSINAVNGLPAGHVIADPASIYFDYNAPAMTGPADVIMLDVTGVKEVKSTAIVIGPNPMSDYTQVTLKGSSANSFKFRVMDMTGRVVTEQQSRGNTLLFSRNSLAAGMYSYYIIQNNVVVNIGKLVIE